MLNNEEPINLMFRTSPQLLTTSSYDSIRRQNYGGIILLQRAPHLCTSGSYTQPPKYALSDHSQGSVSMQEIRVESIITRRIIHVCPAVQSKLHTRTDRKHQNTRICIKE